MISLMKLFFVQRDILMDMTKKFDHEQCEINVGAEELDSYLFKSPEQWNVSLNSNLFRAPEEDLDDVNLFLCELHQYSFENINDVTFDSIEFKEQQQNIRIFRKIKFWKKKSKRKLLTFYSFQAK